jgi:hypothetical protein
MRVFYLIMLLFFALKVSAQDILYTTTGEPTPAKIVEIQAEKIKFKDPGNLTGPDHSKSVSKSLFAFNSAGDYLVFSDKKSVTDGKDLFLTEVPQPRAFDILVDNKGVVLDINVTAENDNDITGTRHYKTIKAAKASLVLLIRKNGTHQLYIPADKAAAYLINAKAKIAQLFAPAAAGPAQGPAVATKPAVITAGDMDVDMVSFNKKALDKTKELSNYLSTICSVNTSAPVATKTIGLAVDLFVNEDARVEVSSVNALNKPQYKIRSYLNRLQKLSGQYDKVDIEYANINYASKFTLGADGNYYAVITFVQKFKGFSDGKVIYGDVTRRNVTVVLKSYLKTGADGDTKKAWDVFLEDIGVVQTHKV